MSAASPGSRVKSLRTDFSNLLLQDFLETSPYPAFVIDLAEEAQSKFDTPQIVYANNYEISQSKGLSLIDLLQENVAVAGQGHTGFWTWVTERTGVNNSEHLGPFTFAGLRWVKTTVKSRWRIISGYDCTTGVSQGRKIVQDNAPEYTSEQTPVLETIQEPPASEAPENLPLSQDMKMTGDSNVLPSDASGPRLGDLDKVLQEEPVDISLPGRLAKHVDLSKTSLGPVDTWTPEFRTMWNFAMADTRAATLIWGPDRCMFWNEAYLDIVGALHPSKFGLPFKDIFPEVPEFYNHFAAIEENGQAITDEDSEFHLFRNGVFQETYYDFSLVPVFQGNRIFGFFNPAFDTTRQHITERRMATLISVGDSLAATRNLKDFWSRVVTALKLYEHDFPFAAIYSVSSLEDESDTVSNSSEPWRKFPQALPKLNLEGSIGIPDAHPAARYDVDLSRGREGFDPYFVEAAHSGEVVVLHTYDGTLPESLLQGIRCGKYKDPCRSVVILPIMQRGGAENVGGFVLLGLNPRRPYGEDYHNYFKLLSQLLGASMANTLLIEEEMRRSRTAAKRAAMDQALLEQELAHTLRQARRLEMQFTHFADRAPIGINVFNADGEVLYANPIWYDLTEYDRSEAEPMGWMKDAFKAGGGDSQDVWHALLVEKNPVTFECRMKKPWTPPGNDGDMRDDYTWILASAFPEVNHSDGSVESIIGCFMDISQQKYVEELQTRRMNEAIDAKKMQENFIDMTSHEMRNPLSAIIHCCDGIISALTSDSSTSSSNVQVSEDAISSSLEAARTILHCSAHQRRIVDDILVLSKIESDLLPIAPANVRIRTEVEAIMSMFQAEIKSADITLKFEVHESFRGLLIDRVFVDPSRLAQVFINLMTNAIKFTRTEQTRRIRVRIAASLDRPEVSRSGIKYVPRKHVDFEDVTSRTEWGTGEVIYLQFSVADTGSGLTEAELEHLFGRFAQASPRTHVRYGGSGLGLYIARELTEKQGGAIGVASEAGKGSAFSFFIKARRAPPVEHEPQAQAPHSKLQPRAALAMSESLPSTVLNGVPPPADMADVSQPHSPLSDRSVAAQFPILIVEDNVVNRMVLKKQLSRLGFPIHEANHGQEALSFLQESKFWAGKESSGKELSMVLMDLEMPVMDGLTCVRQIRALQEAGTLAGHVPTIAVTANARREQIEKAMAAGMDRVVCKPFRIPELVQEMSALTMEHVATPEDTG